MTKDEALRLALEWIEAQPEPRMIGAAKVVQSLRAALAQKDEQELVAWQRRLVCDELQGRPELRERHARGDYAVLE